MRVDWVAFFAPPGQLDKVLLSAEKREALVGQRHRAKPDRDNIDKALLDALLPRDEVVSDTRGLFKRWDWDERLEVVIAFERGATK